MHPPNFPAMSNKQVKRVERTFVITSYYSLSWSRWYEKGSETSQEIAGECQSYNNNMYIYNAVVVPFFLQSIVSSLKKK